MNLTERELATILAALRHLVEFYNEDPDFQESLAADWSEHFRDVRPLTPDEIDDVCERLNTVGSTVVRDLREPGGGALMTQLTREDWIEIYYALDSKANAIANGDYGEADDEMDPEASDQAWIAHLASIMKKIGPDGKAMLAPDKAPQPDHVAGLLNDLRLAAIGVSELIEHPDPDCPMDDTCEYSCIQEFNTALAAADAYFNSRPEEKPCPKNR